MSETTTSPTADAKPSDSAPSSAVTPTDAATTPAPADSSTPSSGSDSTSPSSGENIHQSDREGLLAAVRKVVPTQPKKDAAPSDEEPSEADQEPTTEAAQDKVVAEAAASEPDASQEEVVDLDTPDPSEDELKRLNTKTRKRIKVVLAQRDAARRELEQVQPELQAHRRLRGYLETNQLAPDDVNMLLGVGAALRRQDFKAFLEGVTPYVMVAQEALGIRIAPDIQKQVDEGLVSEDAARDLTRTRYRALRAEHELNANRTQTATDTQSRSRAANVAAVDAWEDNIRKRDPDYASHKQAAVRRYSQALIQERGYPPTPEQSVALVQAAYDEVSREMARLRPAPRATRNTPSGIHVATNGTVPEPKSMKEAALMALQNMRRAS